MMLPNFKITEIFFIIGEFSKVFDRIIKEVKTYNTENGKEINVIL